MWCIRTYCYPQPSWLLMMINVYFPKKYAWYFLFKGNKHEKYITNQKYDFVIVWNTGNNIYRAARLRKTTYYKYNFETCSIVKLCYPKGNSIDRFAPWILIIMTSNGNIFRVTATLSGESTSHRWIPITRAVTRKFDVFYDLRLNKHLSKQSIHWWF